MGKKRFISVLMMLIMVFTISVPPVISNAATISKQKATMEIDSVLTLKVSGASNVKWTSSNKKIAKVTSKGKITAKKEGTAIITASFNKTKLTCTVTVVDSNKQGNTPVATPTPTPKPTATPTPTPTATPIPTATPTPRPTATPTPTPAPAYDQSIYSIGVYPLYHATTLTVFKDSIDIQTIYYQNDNGAGHRMVIINAYYKDSTGTLQNGWFTGVELDEDDGDNNMYYNPVAKKYVWITAYNRCPYAASTLTNSVLLEKEYLITEYNNTSSIKKIR